MNISILLLTASCLSGGAGQTTVSELPPAVSNAPQVIATSNVVYSEEKPGLFAGLREKLSQWRWQHSQQPCYSMHSCRSMQPSCCTPQQTVMQASYMQQSTAEPPLAPLIQTVAAKQVEMPVKKDFRTKVGCAEDYQWVTGQLFYLHVDGGVWVVRYVSVGQEDRFGGSVVLSPSVNMKNFREGDLVCIHGELLNQGRATPRLGGPLYRVDAIDLVERAD